MKRNTIIFDLDGTLLNTLDDIADSLNVTLEKCGYPTWDKKDIRKMIGGGASLLVSRALPEEVSLEEYEQCKKEFLAHYIKNADNKTDLYEGTRPLVKQLAEEQFKMGVVSNKGDKAVQQLIKAYFEEDMQMALGEREDITRKPAPDALFLAMEMLDAKAEECIYVGDSEVDVEFARNAGIPCIIVTWGFRDREELQKVNPDVIVDTVEELYQEIQNYGYRHL